MLLRPIDPDASDASPRSARRALAIADALAWPAAWIAAMLLAPVKMGIVGAVVIAVASISAARRLRRAAWDSDRYVFSTGTWAWRLAVFALFAASLVMASRVLSG